MIELNNPANSVDRSRSLLDPRIHPTKPGAAAACTAPAAGYQDRQDARIPAEGEVPEVHNSLFREPRSLQQLLKDTRAELTQAGGLREQMRVVDTFVHDVNVVDGYLASYPPIPIYRYSNEELRAAQQMLRLQAELAGPCNPRANASMLLHNAIEQALEWRKEPVNYAPKIILL